MKRLALAAMAALATMAFVDAVSVAIPMFFASIRPIPAVPGLAVGLTSSLCAFGVAAVRFGTSRQSSLNTTSRQITCTAAPRRPACAPTTVAQPTDRLPKPRYDRKALLSHPVMA